MAAQDMTKVMVGIVVAGLALSCGRTPIEPWPIVPITAFADSCPQTGTPGALTKVLAFPNDDLPGLFGAFGPCRLLLTSGSNDPNTGAAPLLLSDGTPDGTQTIADRFSGRDFQMLGRTAVFRSLWRTDGTRAGSFQLVHDLYAPSNADRVADTAVFGGVMLFAGSTDQYPYNGPPPTWHGFELWRTDGTQAGTFMAGELVPGPTSMYRGPDHMVILNGAVMVSSTDGDLWRSDGTVAGTRRIAPLSNRAGAVLGGALLFVGGPHDASGAITSVGLWRTDGTEAGTSLLQDLGTPDAEHASFYIGRDNFSLVPLGDRMIVLASPGLPSFSLEGGGTTFSPGPPMDAVWVSDGTAAGTHFVTELPEFSRFNTTFDARVLNGAVLFGSSAQGEAPELFSLWRTDGTAAGTFRLAPLFTFLDADTANGNVFFAAATNETGRELWVSDGTVANTHLVKDINPGRADGLEPADARLPNSIGHIISAAVGRGIILEASDGTHGFEPWFSDGTAAGTQLIADIFPGDQASALGRPASMNGAGYFMAKSSASHGYALWRLDPP
jgi:ELWxxDGT repeat protein